MTDAPLLTLEQAAERLQLGRDRTRAAIDAGQIPSVLVGRSRMVPAAALDEWLRTAAGWQPPIRSLGPATRIKARHQARKVKRRRGPVADDGLTYAQRQLRQG